MGDVSAEPSMEDILSSIKRIIAEEGDDRPMRPRRNATGRLSSGAAPEQERHLPDDEPDEVLELSHPMPPSPGRSSANGGSAPTPPATPPAVPPPAAARDDEADAAAALLSEQTAQATRGAIDTLSKLLVKPEPKSDGTLEGLVRDMLRPMLREWLDANLPSMVEAIVAREIAKLTRGMS